MSVRSMLAKDWQVDVDTASDPTGATSVWVQIKGLKSMQETISETEMDDSDFDSGGYGSDLVTQRKVVLACTSSRKQIVQVGFADDPGQAFVRAAGRLVGYGASIYIRYYRKDGAPDAYTGEVHVTGVGGGGGSVTDLEGFAPSFKFHGQPLPITNPLNTLAIPAISTFTSLDGTPATLAAAGGELVAITGTGFSRVAATGGVFIAGNSALYTIEGDNRIVAIAPAHAAGSNLPVVVTNTQGASTTGATKVTYV